MTRPAEPLVDARRRRVLHDLRLLAEAQSAASTLHCAERYADHGWRG